MQRNTFSYNFYCRKSKENATGEAPVELSIVINGKRCFINLPFRTKPHEFNHKKQPKYISDYLAGMRLTINKIIADIQSNHVPLTAETLRRYIRCGGFKSYTVGELFEDFLTIAKARVGVETNMNTYRKYELVRNLVYSYVSKGDEVEVLTNELMIKIFTDLQSRFKKSTSSSYMRKIKTIVMFARDNGRLSVNPFSGLKIKRDNPEIDYLSEKELDILGSVHLENESLQHVLDIFLFICYSGLSFCDAAKLKPDDIAITDGQYVIKKPRTKSKIEYTAVILPPGIRIFKKYAGNLKLISNQKLNSYLKVIQTQLGFKHNLYCHLGRKTYATLLINHGVPITSVARCLGHSEIKTTQRYYARLHNSTVINDVATAFSQKNQDV